MSLGLHVASKESPGNEQAGVPASSGTKQQEAPAVSLQKGGFPLHYERGSQYIFSTSPRNGVTEIGLSVKIQLKGNSNNRIKRKCE